MSKLTDKARGINFDDDDEAPAPPRAPELPRTALGAISASLALGRGVEAENRALKARLRQVEDAAFVEFLDPRRVRPSRFANRHEGAFGGAAFARLKAEIAETGRNVQPIKVRPLPAREEGQPPGYEIAFGHRRHRACLELGLPVAAVVEPMTDPQLFAEMERENRERQDLSPWEQGEMYRRALEAGLFASQRQLASAIGAQSGNVSRAIQLAALPAELVAAFASPLELQYRWLDVLKPLLDRDPEGVLARARELAALQPKLPAREVLQRLAGDGAAAAPAAAARAAPGAVVELQCDGRPAGRWERDARGRLTLRLQAGVLGKAQERRLLEFVQKLLG